MLRTAEREKREERREKREGGGTDEERTPLFYQTGPDTHVPDPPKEKRGIDVCGVLHALRTLSHKCLERSPSLCGSLGE